MNETKVVKHFEEGSGGKNPLFSGVGGLRLNK